MEREELHKILQQVVNREYSRDSDEVLANEDARFAGHDFGPELTDENLEEVSKYSSQRSRRNIIHLLGAGAAELMIGNELGGCGLAASVYLATMTSFFFLKEANNWKTVGAYFNEWAELYKKERKRAFTHPDEKDITSLTELKKEFTDPSPS